MNNNNFSTSINNNNFSTINNNFTTPMNNNNNFSTPRSIINSQHQWTIIISQHQELLKRNYRLYFTFLWKIGQYPIAKSLLSNVALRCGRRLRSHLMSEMSTSCHRSRSCETIRRCNVNMRLCFFFCLGNLFFVSGSCIRSWNSKWCYYCAKSGDK